MKNKIFEQPWAHILLLIILGLLAYSNSFDVPLQFDDVGVLGQNRIITDLKNFVEPSRAMEYDSFFEYQQFKTRYIAWLTFAINYHIHGLNVTGYHLVNLLIHIINALLVYVLLNLSFRTPFLSSSALRHRSRIIGFSVALLFVCHPVQTQAVTYITQRLATLATTFYILSLVMYVKMRLSRSRSLIYYILALLSAVSAMKTKEIAFTLPVVIMLYEFLFFRETLKKRLLYLVPIILTMLIIPLSLVDIDQPLGSIIGDAERATQSPVNIARSDYLFTQFRVIVTYIRLLFLPFNQNLDYDYPIFYSIFDVQVLLSLIFIAILLLLGIFLARLSRFSEPSMRLVSFGIFWFFITLSVESSVIPITDVIFEHRLYLPSTGFFMSTVTGAFLILRRFESTKVHRASIALLATIALLLTAATIQRNSVWKSEISLWEDAVSKSPEKPRALDNLGVAYGKQGQYDKAIDVYARLLRSNPYADYGFSNIAGIYMLTKQYDRAIEFYRKALSINAADAFAMLQLGIAYTKKGLYSEAIGQFNTVVSVNRKEHAVYLYRGRAYQALGNMNKAILDYSIACDLGNKDGCRALTRENEANRRGMPEHPK